MPAYNAASFIAEAIQSVLDQDHANFELLIINDGSTDETKEIVHSFSDKRISYYEQTNKGVSAARNVGLDNMRGDYFCFLDSDDLYPEKSLSSRVFVLNENSNVSFVDGAVLKIDESGDKNLNTWRPNFKGNPLEDLILLTGKSFFGQSWLIRREVLRDIRFKEGMTHGEDLLFYLMLSRNKKNKYTYTDETILKYRIHPKSAMHGDLKKLELAYKQINDVISDWVEVSMDLKRAYRKKTSSIMIKSYLRNFEVRSSLLQFVNYFQ